MPHALEDNDIIPFYPGDQSDSESEDERGNPPCNQPETEPVQNVVNGLLKYRTEGVLVEVAAHLVRTSRLANIDNERFYTPRHINLPEPGVVQKLAYLILKRLSVATCHIQKRKTVSSLADAFIRTFAPDRSEDGPWEEVPDREATLRQFLVDAEEHIKRLREKAVEKGGVA
jgi:hypothetical protein